MSKSGFLSLDDDIDLDALLGDYTEDDDNDVQHKKPKKTPPPPPPSDAGLRCPVRSRVLKTIAGFRGHVTKLHDKPHLKATFIIYNTAENPISKTTSTDLYTSIADIFPAIFGATLKRIDKDPMHKLFGESEVTL
uniref:Uncharacterized protein n=1 Tax=Magallana gigas TaxID=29159 RepID=A0A8W8LHD4_MAGGI